MWWPGSDCDAPSKTALGQLAQLRIVDTHDDPDGVASIEKLRAGYEEGDTNLSWTRLTRWRAQIAAVLDQPPYEQVQSVEVVGGRVSSGVLLMAGWLKHYLGVPVTITTQEDNLPGNLRTVRLIRESGTIELERLAQDTARLRQTGYPDQIVPLMLRDRYDVLSEELRSLAHDPVYEAALMGGTVELNLEELQ